jgi:hypothetical protein
MMLDSLNINLALDEQSQHGLNSTPIPIQINLLKIPTQSVTQHFNLCDDQLPLVSYFLKQFYLH